MPPEARDAARLYDMLESARAAIEYCQERQREDLENNRMLADAVVRRIEVVGEAARGISQTLQVAHPEVAWRAIMATRHIIVHEYDRIDFNIVWRIVVEHLPPLIQQIEMILSEMPPPPVVEE